MLSSWFGGYNQRRDSGVMVIIGLICMVLYWVLSLFVLGLSRFREYYADRASVEVVEDGSRKLSEALAKIVNASSKLKVKSHKEVSNLNSFKTLFISDPERSDRDSVELSVFNKSDQAICVGACVESGDTAQYIDAGHSRCFRVVLHRAKIGRVSDQAL